MSFARRSSDEGPLYGGGSSRAGRCDKSRTRFHARLASAVVPFLILVTICLLCLLALAGQLLPPTTYSSSSDTSERVPAAL